MPKEPIRTSRLEARIDPGVLSLVKRAAELLLDYYELEPTP